MSTRSARRAQRAQEHADAAARALDGFVRTPAALAGTIVEMSPERRVFTRNAVVLEPSAGDGALVRAILDANSDVRVVAVEPNGPRADGLYALAREHPGRVEVHECMFEEYAERHRTTRFDAVIMNPPFGTSTADLVWMAHIRSAWLMLHSGAQLVSVVPGSYASRGDKAHTQFREWAAEQGARYTALPADSFAESGTGVHAGVLVVPKPMPARPGGMPSWLVLPAAGDPVQVPGDCAVTATAALTTPVQDYIDRFDGDRRRVIRYVGTCYGCARPLWRHDGRSDAAAWEARSLDPDGFGYTGPSVGFCLDCHDRPDLTARALHDAAPYWQQADAGEQGGPDTLPLDLAAGLWATVTGVDSRGWDSTVTGRVMADPVHTTVAGVECVSVRLRTATGNDVELFVQEADRVIVRDVPDDVVPTASNERRQPAAAPPADPKVDPAPAGTGVGYVDTTHNIMTRLAADLGRLGEDVHAGMAARLADAVVANTADRVLSPNEVMHRILDWRSPKVFRPRVEQAAADIARALDPVREPIEAGTVVRIRVITTDGRVVTADVVAESVTKLHCGCRRVRAARPGPADGGRSTDVGLLSGGCDRHFAQFEAIPVQPFVSGWWRVDTPALV